MHSHFVLYLHGFSVLFFFYLINSTIFCLASWCVTCILTSAPPPPPPKLEYDTSIPLMSLNSSYSETTLAWQSRRHFVSFGPLWGLSFGQPISTFIEDLQTSNKWLSIVWEMLLWITRRNTGFNARTSFWYDCSSSLSILLFSRNPFHFARSAFEPNLGPFLQPNSFQIL